MSQKIREDTTLDADAHLMNTNDLYGTKVIASDGDIGFIEDFYFDDSIWAIRYAAVDTGTWLPGRQVLLSPYAFAELDEDKATLSIHLSKAKIQGSPPIESGRTVSRQSEIGYFHYFDWPPYWVGDGMWGKGGYPTLVPSSMTEIEGSRLYYHRDDLRLRGTKEVLSYPIQTTDGIIGNISGYLVDKRSWAIRKLIVETGRWNAGTKILVATNKINWISYIELKVYASQTKSEILSSFDPDELNPGKKWERSGHLHV
jgi:hypothetical protein